MGAASEFLRAREGRGPLRSLLDGLAGFGALVASARRAALDAEDLYALTDTELQRSGLTRGEIPQLLLRRHFS